MRFTSRLLYFGRSIFSFTFTTVHVCQKNKKEKKVVKARSSKELYLRGYTAHIHEPG